jgi:hypothetical protein
MFKFYIYYRRRLYDVSIYRTDMKKLLIVY